jgi:rhodanese-related sulfurtransferase
MKKVILITILAFSVTFFSGCNWLQMTEEPAMDNEVSEPAAEYEYTDISAEEAKDLIDNNPDLVVIDVSPNYDEGHIPSAVNYYLGDGSLEDAIPDLDAEEMYLVYCHFESASRQGAQALVDAGFENVYRLEGDYSAWVNAGYPVEQ